MLKEVLLFIFVLMISIPTYFVVTNSPEKSFSGAFDFIQKSNSDRGKCEVKEEFKGGTDAKLSLVSCGKVLFVIRTLSHRNIYDRFREIHALKIASEEGYGPKVYSYSWARGWVVMEYIKDRKDPRSRQEQIESFAKLVRRIHDGPKFYEHFLLFEEVEEQITALKTLPSGLSTETLKKTLNKILSSKPLAKVPTHRDLASSNILFDGEYRVIDFESVGLDDPFIDLATVAMFNTFNEEEDLSLLTSYFSRKPTQEELTHFKIMRKAVYLIYGLRIFNFVPEDLKSKSIEVEKPNHIRRLILSGKLKYADPMTKLKWARAMLFEAVQ